MKSRYLVALAMPVVAAAAMGVLLQVTHHTTMPSLRPAAGTPGSPATPGQAGQRGSSCLGTIATPFAGIAVASQIRARVTNFQQITGAHIKVVEFYNPFPGPFQRAEAQQATNLGAVPLIQLNPRHISMADLAAGRYDAAITSYAEAVRAYGCHVVLSFGHEMNGWWYPWGLPRTQPATFIKAWRHMHRVFARLHATNVIWSWDPTHQHGRFRQGKVATAAGQWYPGDKYVGWIGIDGYLGHGQKFSDVFAGQLRSIRSVAKSKLIYLAETGVAPGPAQARQIANLFDGMRMSRISGLIWFDIDAKQPWRLEGDPAGAAAYRAGIASLITRNR